MRYGKLVRDKIPEYIRARGGNPRIHIAGENEYWRKLKEKLREEIGEYLASGDKEELVDILEVLDAMIVCKRLRKRELAAFKKRKAAARGKFTKRIILDAA